MSLSSLQVLADNRDALLLAQAVGWFHDYRKCSEEHLQTLAASSQGQGIPRSELGKKHPNLQNVQLTLLGLTRNLLDLLDDRTWRNDALGQILSRCHNTSHFDKQEPANGRQNYSDTQTSSPFGFEQPITSGLTNSMWSLPWNDLATISTPRPTLRQSVQRLFSQAIADSRRPINEVDLWSWGCLVGALYKSALAGAILTNTLPTPQDLRWRLLTVRVNGLEYLSQVARIPDLLARQRILSDAVEQVQELLEITYPLGSEVYRDHNGSVFVVPDIADLLNSTDSNGTPLSLLISQAFEQATEGDLTPHIELEDPAWWGQDPKWPNSNNDKLPNIKAILAKQVLVQPSLSSVQGFWNAGQTGELCPVCRLRPMREGAEACPTCLNRRQSRVQEWLANPRTTIWMDEISDHNDRVALLVGRFGLDGWLAGDLVQTMLVRADPTTNTFTPKNPSPARLRRIWETCQRFWTETVEQKILAQHEYGKGDVERRIRRLIIPDKKTGWKENVPYDGTVDGKAISLLWRQDAQCFITISNLQLSGEIKPDQVIHLDDPDIPGRQVSFTVQGTMPAPEAMGTYAPYLPLLASPDQFLALVPAAEALEIAEKIRAEYAKQFGKVQNRLPLFLGLVFFQRKTPLMAAMDTARRMLASEWEEGKWRVADPPQNDGKKVTLALEQNGRRITFEVPIVMGDDSTEDVWYPYFELVGQPAGHHTLRFERDGEWWVHVKTLQAGDTVCVTPSRFAYLFLESTAQRFRFDPERDVMLLDELPRLRKMWDNICHSPEMTDTKLHAIHALFETKRQEWKLREPTPGQPITDSTFRQLVETTLKRDRVQGVTVEDVLCGRFQRCLDLHLRILKHRVK